MSEVYRPFEDNLGLKQPDALFDIRRLNGGITDEQAQLLFPFVTRPSLVSTPLMLRSAYDEYNEGNNLDFGLSGKRSDFGLSTDEVIAALRQKLLQKFLKGRGSDTLVTDETIAGFRKPMAKALKRALDVAVDKRVRNWLGNFLPIATDEGVDYDNLDAWIDLQKRALVHQGLIREERQPESSKRWSFADSL